MRTPNFAEHLSMANAAKKAQLERARRIADDPESAERRKAREEMAAARNHRVAEREVCTTTKRYTVHIKPGDCGMGSLL